MHGHSSAESEFQIEIAEQSGSNSKPQISSILLRSITIIGGLTAGGAIHIVPSSGEGTLVGCCSESATVSLDGVQIHAVAPDRTFICTFAERADISLPPCALVLVVLPAEALKRAGIHSGKAGRFSSEPDPALDLVTSTARCIPGRDLPEPLALACERGLLSMLALAARETDGPADDPRHSRRRAVLFQEILRDVAEHCHEHDFGAALVAQRHKLNIRTIQKLFQQYGTTLKDHITHARLQMAVAALADPSMAGKRISDIAFEAGFNDIATFNRLFRRHFSQSPSTFRRERLSEAPR